MTQIRHRFLFNFAASYSTGGYKRLHEYAKWFNANGGAWFIIHPRCSHLVSEFRELKFFVATQSRIGRLFDDCGYLRSIGLEIGQPELYYAYGVPLYSRFGKVNWFHFSNVLPLSAGAFGLPLFARWKAALLGKRIRAGLGNADVISAESDSSLRLLAGQDPRKLFRSVNGSDDEIAELRSGRQAPKECVATVVGTTAYKALEESYRVFVMLREMNPALQLVVIGNPDWVPPAMRSSQDVSLCGVLPRTQVMDFLRKSQYYISTTRVENSYNAAAEGIFCAGESYISKIGPHRELLANERFEEVSIPGARECLFKVRRQDLSGINLKSWDAVVSEMIARFQEALRVV